MDHALSQQQLAPCSHKFSDALATSHYCININYTVPPYIVFENVLMYLTKSIQHPAYFIQYIVSREEFISHPQQRHFFSSYLETLTTCSVGQNLPMLIYPNKGKIYPICFTITLTNTIEAWVYVAKCSLHTSINTGHRQAVRVAGTSPRHLYSCHRLNWFIRRHWDISACEFIALESCSCSGRQTLPCANPSWGWK